MVPQKRTLGVQGGAVAQQGAALTAVQLGLLIGIGAALWFAAALAVRFGGPAGFFGPTASVLAFALAIPLCWASVQLTRRIVGLGQGQLLPGIGVGSITATFCDGIALTWGRGLYGTDPDQIVFGAAWILWGVGLFLLFAYLGDQRRAA
jgi:hypothetical protein